MEKVRISGYSHSGAGVARVNGKVIFVPGALQGEEVLIDLIGKQKGIMWGKIKEILEPVEERTTPICSVYSSCGGCHLQHVTYEGQLKIKEQLVRDALIRLGGLKEPVVRPVVGMKHPWGYRNKGIFHVSKVKEKVILGFFAESSHRIVKECCAHLFSPQVYALLNDLAAVLTKYQVAVVDHDGKGLHHILIRESKTKGEILLVLAVYGEFSKEKEKIAREICQKHPQVVGICHSNILKLKEPFCGGQTSIIIGKDYFEDKIGSFRFTISPFSFLQVNPNQTEVLYQKALDYAQLSGNEVVVDAYCGIGTLSLFLAQKAKKVIGIETVAEAVSDARLNAKRNKVENVEFIEGEAEKNLPQLVKAGLKPDVVIVDPPRKGCGQELLKSIVEVQPERIVYVSCNPTTLARDLRYLVANSFNVCEIQPVDMFPHTHHVECVVLMSLVKE